ncbi:hypothetical protein BH24ACT5_BH24ACT5_18630 [soil metagenome]
MLTAMNHSEPAFDRRRALQLVGGAGVVAVGGRFALVGRTAAATTIPSDPGASAHTTLVTGSCDVIPEETAGPFPGDGSNGVNVLTESGIVRRDITTSLDPSTTVAEGVPLEIQLLVADASGDCAPLVGAAVYIWHCDRQGRYSMYSNGVEDETYLRGVQEADANGAVTFTSIFPGCYSGRWPHIHFDVYRSLADATDSTSVIATSQIALPEDICSTVYAESGYEQSFANLARVSLDRDNVFGDDGAAHQLGTVTGSIDNGDVSVALYVPV